MSGKVWAGIGGLISLFVLMAVGAIAMTGGTSEEAASAPTTTTALPVETAVHVRTALVAVPAGLKSSVSGVGSVLAGANTALTTTTAATPAATTSASGTGAAVGAASSNWAGYVATRATFTDVSGSWTQPTGSCTNPTDGITAMWIGLDGETSKSVEQTGSTFACSGGKPYQYAWYELYPAPPVYLPLNDEVSSGDKFTGSVTKSGQNFTITLSNTSKVHASWTYTKTAAAPDATASSAEWVIEAPAINDTTLAPLANFGSVAFTDCKATTGGKSSVVNSLPFSPMGIYDSGGRAQTTTTKLGSSGSAFSVNFG